MTNDNKTNGVNETNALQKLFYNKKEIRMAWKNDEPWWVLKDVCDVLGIKNNRQAADRLDDDERCMFNIRRQGDTIIINESGLYNVILRSDKPEAKKFKRWITHDVLHSIRKYGAYITPEKLSELENNPNALPQLIRKIQEDKIIIETQQNIIEEQREKVVLANAYLSTGETVSIGEFAKILNSNGVKTGQNRLFQMLRDNGFIMKLENSQFNAPTQKATDMKLLRVIRRVNINESGNVSFSKTTQITAKGQLYFTKFFLVEQKGEEKKDMPTNCENHRPKNTINSKNAINFSSIQKKKI